MGAKVLVQSVCNCAVLVLVLGITSGINAERWHDLPPGFEKCKFTDPNLNECLRKATDRVKPYLVQGVPQLNVPKIEPFFVPEISLEQGTSALNFKALLKNITIRGISNYKFSQFDMDIKLPILQWFTKCTIKPIELEGDYTVTGRVLIAPIEGKGKFHVTIDETTVVGYQKAELQKKKDGKEYSVPITTNTSISVGGTKVKLEGLFGGNEEINNVTNRVINENIEVLFEELKPAIEDIITKIFEEGLVGALSSNIPFYTLYPKD